SAVRIELGLGSDDATSGVIPGLCRALMLVCWLATRLGWEAVRSVDLRRGTTWTIGLRRRDGAPVLATITALATERGELSGIRAITLQAGDSEGGAVFGVERADDRVG